MASRKIRIVGGGIGGLILATQLGKRFKRSDTYEVTLIDRDATHIWKPMLHAIAAGTWNVYQQQLPYLAHAKDHGYSYVPGELSGIDRARKQIELAPFIYEGETIIERRTLDYDVLIIAVGSQANDFGIPGVSEFCHFIDSQVQAESFNIRLRGRIIESVVHDEVLHVAIVGAGATGVELCAELSQLLDAAAAYGDPNIRRRLHLTLLESGPRILPAFPESVSNSTAEQLRKIGVDVRVNVRVIAAEAGGFRLADESLVPAQIMVWAAGVKAARFLNGIDGLETSRPNQLLVRPTLQTTLDDHIFALGDCASLTPPGETRPLAPTAQVAHQQAMHLSRYFPDWLEGKPLPGFQYRDFGSLVSLGEYNAFGTLGRFGFFKGGFIRGRFAQFSHAMLYRRHQLVLHGFLKSTLLWAAEHLNAFVRPKIRLS